MRRPHSNIDARHEESDMLEVDGVAIRVESVELDLIASVGCIDTRLSDFLVDGASDQN